MTTITQLTPTNARPWVSGTYGGVEAYHGVCLKEKFSAVDSDEFATTAQGGEPMVLHVTQVFTDSGLLELKIESLEFDAFVWHGHIRPAEFTSLCRALGIEEIQVADDLLFRPFAANVDGGRIVKWHYPDQGPPPEGLPLKVQSRFKLVS